MPYTDIHLRKIIEVEGLDRSYQFAPSTFSSGKAYIVHADPATVLSSTNDKPGYKQEPVGEGLNQYRLAKQFQQDTNCPVVFPSIYIPFHHSGTIDCYDMGLVRYAISLGIHSLPFSILGDENKVRDYAGSIGAEFTGEIEDDYIFKLSPSEAALRIGEGVTRAVSMEEMIQGINNRLSLYQSSHTDHLFDRMQQDEKSSIAGFVKCNDHLDALIANGCSFVNADRYWDGNSLLQAMEAYLEDEPVNIATNPMELIDRFHLLHEMELKREHNETASYMKFIDTIPAEKGLKYSGIIAEDILKNKEILDIASSQFSEKTRGYLLSFSDTSTKKVVSLPMDAAP